MTLTIVPPLGLSEIVLGDVHGLGKYMRKASDSDVGHPISRMAKQAWPAVGFGYSSKSQSGAGS